MVMGHLLQVLAYYFPWGAVRRKRSRPHQGKWGKKRFSMTGSMQASHYAMETRELADLSFSFLSFFFFFSLPFSPDPPLLLETFPLGARAPARLVTYCLPWATLVGSFPITSYDMDPLQFALFQSPVLVPPICLASIVPVQYFATPDCHYPDQ